MGELPRIISVDDHVLEPPTLWTDRLSKRFGDRVPHIVRDKAKFGMKGGVFSFEKGTEDGEWCDWWLYDDLVYPFPKLSAAIGFEDLDVTPVTYDEIRPGCWIQKDRLLDMTANHVEASICFPNTLPRFCGQTFYERKDKELALLCVQAYNDWMIDEWCAGDGKGRLIPLGMIPLWDPQLAAAEVHRNAARGCFAVTFSLSPSRPSSQRNRQTASPASATTSIRKSTKAPSPALMPRSCTVANSSSPTAPANSRATASTASIR